MARVTLEFKDLEIFVNCDSDSIFKLRQVRWQKSNPKQQHLVGLEKRYDILIPAIWYIGPILSCKRNNEQFKIDLYSTLNVIHLLQTIVQ